MEFYVSKAINVQNFIEIGTREGFLRSTYRLVQKRKYEENPTFSELIHTYVRTSRLLVISDNDFTTVSIIVIFV